MRANMSGKFINDLRMANKQLIKLKSFLNYIATCRKIKPINKSGFRWKVC